MLQEAWKRGVPMRWVAGDEVYGESTALRDGIAASGHWYLLGVRTVMPVWTQRPPEAKQPWMKSRLHRLRHNRWLSGAPILLCSWSDPDSSSGDDNPTGDGDLDD